MLYRNLEPVSKQLTIVIGLTVVGFMAFGLAVSLYRNVLFEQTLDQMSLQNRALENQNDRSRGDLEYYESTRYKDKYAKENLNKLNPGEKVLIVQEESAQLNEVLNPEQAAEEREAAYEELLRQMPVIEHWKLYLFGRDKLEELRRSIPIRQE